MPVAGEVEGTRGSRRLSLQATAPARTVTQVHTRRSRGLWLASVPSAVRAGLRPGTSPIAPIGSRSGPVARPCRWAGHGATGLRGGRGAPFGPADVLVGRCVRRGRGGVAGVRRRGGAAAGSRGGRPRRPGWCAHRWPHRRLPGVDLHKDSAPGRVRSAGSCRACSAALEERWRSPREARERRVRAARDSRRGPGKGLPACCPAPYARGGSRRNFLARSPQGIRSCCDSPRSDTA